MNEILAFSTLCILKNLIVLGNLGAALKNLIEASVTDRNKIKPNSVKTLSNNLSFFSLLNTVWLIQWTILFCQHFSGVKSSEVSDCFSWCIFTPQIWFVLQNSPRLLSSLLHFDFYVIEPASVLNDFGIWKTACSWCVGRSIVESCG